MDYRGDPHSGDGPVAGGTFSAPGHNARQGRGGDLFQPYHFPLHRRLHHGPGDAAVEPAPADRAPDYPDNRNRPEANNTRVHGGYGVSVDVDLEHGDHDDDGADSHGGDIQAQRVLARAGGVAFLRRAVDRYCLCRLHRGRGDPDRNPAQSLIHAHFRYLFPQCTGNYLRVMVWLWLAFVGGIPDYRMGACHTILRQGEGASVNRRGSFQERTPESRAHVRGRENSHGAVCRVGAVVALSQRYRGGGVGRHSRLVDDIAGAQIHR